MSQPYLNKSCQSVSVDRAGFWSEAATKKLIALYAEYQEEMENPRRKKILVWGKIAAQMVRGGFDPAYDKKRCQQKWRNLLRQYKNYKANRRSSGRGRKTFSFYKEMDEVVGRRHDIVPPVLGGNGLNNIEPSSSTLQSNERQGLSLPSSSSLINPSSPSPLDTSSSSLSASPSTSGTATPEQTSTPSTSADRRRNSRKRKTDEQLNMQAKFYKLASDYAKKKESWEKRKIELLERIADGMVMGMGMGRNQQNDDE